MLKTALQARMIIYLDWMPSRVENQKYLIKTWDFCWYGVKNTISPCFKDKMCFVKFSVLEIKLAQVSILIKCI